MSLSPTSTFAGKAKNRPKKDTLLLPYQAKWVRDDSRLKLMEKSRQIGLSWASAYRCVSTTSLRDARYDDWVSSRDELQAQLFIQDCKSFAGLLDKGSQDLGERVLDDRKNSGYVLRYSNGLCTNSLSSNPDAQAGKRGRRVLDEFALHPDPRKLYSIAYPGITWGGNMELISTHRGSANFFNELVEEIKHKGNPKGFSLHTVRLEDALADGFLYKLQCKLPAADARQQMDEADYFNFVKAGCATEEDFLQEFCCVPADDNSAFLSYDLIAGCEYRGGEVWQKQAFEKGESLFVGVDVGRDHDLTVIWIGEKLGDVLHTRQVLTFRGETFAAQEAALYEWLALPQVKRCCIDQTGLGRQFAERATERFGNYKVEGIHFTAGVKEELAYPVRAAFEDRTLRLPSDPVIRADLRAIRKESTASGHVRFTADRGKNGHADRFWALALALHAAKNPGSFGAQVG
jgi:phage FluMu gp28-like protein